MACILYFEFKPWWTIISIGRKYLGKSVLHIEFVVVTQVKNIDHKCVYQILSNHFGIQGENYFGGFWSSSTSDQSFWDASKICSIYFAHLWRFDAISLTHLNLLSQFFILSLSSVPIATANTLHFFEKFSCFHLHPFGQQSLHGTKILRKSWEISCFVFLTAFHMRIFCFLQKNHFTPSLVMSLGYFYKLLQDFGYAVLQERYEHFYVSRFFLYVTRFSTSDRESKQ